MGGRREKYIETPRDPAAVIRTLRTFRDALLEIERPLRPFGPTFKLIAEIIRAIDVLAEHLTGEPRYFAINGTSATDGQLEVARRKRAREAGEIPWDEP